MTVDGGEAALNQEQQQEQQREQQPKLVIFISTCAANTQRRRAIRRSWFTYKHGPDTPLTAEQRDAVHVVFVASRSEEGSVLSQESAQEHDVVFVDAPEGYGQLWRKALVFLRDLVQASQPQALQGAGQGQAPASNDSASHSVAAWWQQQQQQQQQQQGSGTKAPAHDGAAERDTAVGDQQQAAGHPGSQVDYVMHADDDSYIRLDLLLPVAATWPTQRHYWGYIWDGTGNRCTAPIRNPRNKSYMPEDQYSLEYYPPFASGCGFALSWDLVTALARAEPTLPDYRLLDPPFGVHLCGPPDLCILDQPVAPVHDDRVRPYRPLPMFRPNTLVQHYIKPEEMVPFHHRARKSQAQEAGQEAGQEGTAAAPTGPSSKAEELYNTLVSMGLLRR